jgi:hypothetical protein
MEDHEGRLEAHPVLGRVVPGVERKSDRHIAEEGVARISKLYRFLVGELAAGMLAHVGELHWFHGDFPCRGEMPRRLGPHQLLSAGAEASVVPLSSGGAEGGHSLPEIVRVVPVPESTEQHDRDRGQERIAESESHGSDGKKEAKAAEKAVDDDF